MRASIFSLTGKWITALGYYNKAIETLEDVQEPSFLPIVTAIKAERIAYAIKNKHGNISGYASDLDKTKRQLSDCVSKGVLNDPFAGIGFPGENGSFDDYLRITKRVAN